MLMLVADENFNNNIVRGLLRCRPNLDIVRIQDVGLSGTRYAYKRVGAGKCMPGIFEVSRNVSIKVAVEDILLLTECSLDNEWEGQVQYLPLR